MPADRSDSYKLANVGEVANFTCNINMHPGSAAQKCSQLVNWNKKVPKCQSK